MDEQDLRKDADSTMGNWAVSPTGASPSYPQGTQAEVTGRITDRHRRHMDELTGRFAARMSEKYIAGVREHGGYIGDHALLKLVDAAIDEAIDQFVYLTTIREKITLSPAKAYNNFPFSGGEARQDTPPTSLAVSTDPLFVVMKSVESVRAQIDEIQKLLSDARVERCRKDAATINKSKSVTGPGLR